MTKEQQKAYIEALLRERAGAEQYGRTDTVKDIDAELEKVGHKAKAPAKRATRMTAKKGSEL